jgi:hypothetical protein
MQEFVSFRGLRPLDPHQGFALDPLGASRQPPDPLPSTAPFRNSWIRHWMFLYTFHVTRETLCIGTLG